MKPSGGLKYGDADGRAIEPSGSMYDAGSGTSFLIYPTPNAGQAPNTLMSFSSKDVGADVVALRARGVVFEEYDFPGLKTVHGVAKPAILRPHGSRTPRATFLGYQLRRNYSSVHDELLQIWNGATEVQPGAQARGCEVGG